jgi:hypothetical protein
MDNGCSAPTKTDNGIMRFGAQDNGIMRFGAQDNGIMRFGAQDNGIMKVPISHAGTLSGCVPWSNKKEDQPLQHQSWRESMPTHGLVRWFTVTFMWSERFHRAS